MWVGLLLRQRLRRVRVASRCDGCRCSLLGLVLGLLCQAGLQLLLHLRDDPAERVDL